MTKFEELVAKLSELFELDKADLDFGIHRIIKTKHAQIEAYLKERLPQRVKAVLGELAQAEAGNSLADLKGQVIASLGTTAFDSDGALDPMYAHTPLGEKYVAALAKSRDNRGAEQTEAEVYSHLYEFFSRYYEEGDFISRRRRTAGKETYAVPYDGEEVMLHWANKDQYYIKSSEDLKDYTFTVPGGNTRVHFKLTHMDAVQNNNKATRIFKLDEEAGIQATDDALVIPFHFAEGKKRTQAIEAAWEQSIIDALPMEWKVRLAAKDATYTGAGERSILQKHLRNYTKKNTSDYFIHKDLGGFLRRELDFYIKNEVMYLDDVDSRPAEYLTQELRKIKGIRAVAHDLIDFLAQFEDFQKRLWLKKKFVVETNWCITLDRIPEELYPEIAANDAQREEWVKLFAIDEIEAAEGDLIASATPGYSVPLTAGFLKANDKLLLDTALFPQEFKDRLLAAIDDIDNRTDGLLVHSENLQALSLLGCAFARGIKSVAIDPPYNTGGDGFVYRDQYQHSSWMALMWQSLAAALPMISESGACSVFCDEGEAARLRMCVEDVFGSENLLATICWEKVFAPKPAAKEFSTSVDFLFYAAREKSKWDRKLLPRTAAQDANYKNRDNDPRGAWASDNLLRNEHRDNCVYTIVSPQTGKEWVPRRGTSWRHPEDEMQRLIETNQIWFGGDGNGKPRRKKFLTDVQDGLVPETLWKYGDVGHTQDAKREVISLFGFDSFPTPKPTKLMRRIVQLCTGPVEVVMDFFAGSGSTGNAVIDLNRKDNGKRKYILVEMGDYFDTVLKPRIQKVVYSADWKDGKPTARNTGVSHCFKYLRLESYEDALNNLTLTDRSADTLGLPEDVADDYLLRYSLEVESRTSLLDLDRFEDPFNSTLKIYNRATGEAEPQTIDLPETFNYLLGLRVHTRQMRDGFLVIEGENPAAETVLVIWRNVTTHDNAALEAFVADTLRINTADSEYAAIYINGDTTLDDPHKKVLLTEQVFHELMFDVKDV